MAAVLVLMGLSQSATAQSVFKRIADVNTQLPEGDPGDTFSSFDISRSSLSGTWAAFFAEGNDSDTGLENGIYSNRGNRLGTVGDSNDTFAGGDVIGFLQPVIANYNVYVTPTTVGPGLFEQRIASSSYNHGLANIGGGEAFSLVSGGVGGAVFPLAYETGSAVASLGSPGGSGQTLVSVGPAISAIHGFDYNAANGLLYAADFTTGSSGIVLNTSTIVDSNTEIPGRGVNFEIFQAPILPGGNFQAAFVGGQGAIGPSEFVRGIYAIDQGGDVVTIAERGQPATFGFNPGNWVNFDPVLAPDGAALSATGGAPNPQFAFRGTTENYEGIFLVDSLTGSITPAYLEPDTFRFEGEGSTEYFAFSTAIGRDALHNGKILAWGEVSELGVLPFQNFETIFIIDATGSGFGFPGDSQFDPIMPDTVDPDGTAYFDDAPSGFWFDPPLIDGYAYQTTDGSLFAAILDFPTGLVAPVEVFVEGQSFGTFDAGDELIFPGEGVEAFTIRGIMPPDDLADGADFPLQIAFSTPTADFSMTPIPIPEPASWALALVAFVGLAAGRRVRACLRSTAKGLLRARGELRSGA
ncbi:MAG: hypothetical protein ACOY3P_08445 [Planctomycetota bacterium]